MRHRFSSVLALTAAAMLVSVSALAYWGVVVEPGRLVAHRSASGEQEMAGMAPR